jgi:hypothetical protein
MLSAVVPGSCTYQNHSAPVMPILLFPFMFIVFPFVSFSCGPNSPQASGRAERSRGGYIDYGWQWSYGLQLDCPPRASALPNTRFCSATDACPKSPGLPPYAAHVLALN